MKKAEIKRIMNEIMLCYEAGATEKEAFDMLEGLELGKYEGKDLAVFIWTLYGGGDVSEMLDDYSTEAPVNYRAMSPCELLNLVTRIAAEA